MSLLLELFLMLFKNHIKPRGKCFTFTYFLTLVHAEELTSWTAACHFPTNNVNIIRKDFLFSLCTGFRFTILLW